MGAGLGSSTCLVTDGRFSGASRGFIIGSYGLKNNTWLCYQYWTYVGHVVPEAQEGGPIALVHDNDKIVVDAGLRTIEWLVDEQTKAQRRKEWEAVEM